MKINSYSQHQITEEDKEAVLKALGHQYLSGGELVEKFEQDICDYTGAKYCVTFNSGSSALFAAYSSISIEFLTMPAISYQATATAARLAGKNVHFLDVDERGMVAAQVAVHLNGNTSEMVEGTIIEDAAHAFGARYINGNKVGNCEYSMATCFSFHPLKTITTGEGGAVTTNDINICEALKRFRSNGLEKSGNFRMSAINAALGSSQIKRVGEIVAARKEAAQYYDTRLSDVAVDNDTYSAHHLYVIKHDKSNWIAKKLEEAGYPTRKHYPPLAALPNAIDYYNKALSIPLYAGLSEEYQDEIMEIICSEL